MNVRIAQLLPFVAGNWFNGALEMTQYTVKLWMITHSTDPEEQTIAFRRMRHFMYEHIHSTIFIDAGETAKCVELARAGLNITTLPDEPVEQLIGIMLFHKINAIMEGRIEVMEVEVSSGDGVIYLHDENETSEGIEQPDWWSTPDLIHCDPVLLDSDKVLSIAQSASWRNLDLAWPDVDAPEDSGNIVVFTAFKDSNDSK